MGCMKNLVVAVSGNVGAKLDQIKKWTEAHTGRFSPQVTKDVTHLICSQANWKQQVPAVTAAQKFGVHIVTYDWLEESLHSRRKLSEKKFLLGEPAVKSPRKKDTTGEPAVKSPRKKKDTAEERQEKKKMSRLAKQYDEKRFEDGVQAARNDLGTGTFTPFASTTVREDPWYRNTMGAIAKRRAERLRAEEQKAAGMQEEDVTTHDTDVSNLDGQKEVSVEVERAVEREGRFLQASRSPVPCHPAVSSSLSSSSPGSVGLSTPSTTPCASQSLSPAPAPGPPKAEKLTDSHHLYIDDQGLQYNIRLMRKNPYRNKYAVYTLRIFESHAVPHTYCTVVRYVPPAKDGKDVADRIPILYKLEATKNEAGTPPFPSNGTDTVEKAAEHPNMAAVRAFIEPPIPQSGTFYKDLLAPFGSEFSTAFAAFRAAFAETTFLTWEERLQPQELQKERARILNVEPFEYIRPQVGLPIGLMPHPGVALSINPVQGVGTESQVQEMFGKQRLGLPGMDVPLDSEGKFGGMLLREAEQLRQEKEREEEAQRERERMAKRMKRNNGKTNAGYGHADAGRAMIYGMRGGERGLGMAMVNQMARANANQGRATFVMGRPPKWSSSTHFYEE